MSAVVALIRNGSSFIDPDCIDQITVASNFFKADRVATWQDKNIFLGNYSLFNTPESLREHLPFTHPEYDVTITADVRLDNRKELMQKLGLSDNQLTDSQLILACYLKFGEQCAAHLLGAFAFIIWDGREQKLVAARDHIGVRPLHYYYFRNDLVIATLTRSISAISELDPSVNGAFIKNILITSPLNSDETFFKHIKVLLPAHTLIYQNNELCINKYWELDLTETINYKNPEDYDEAFREIMFEAVRCRLRTNQQIGAELSGGLDSSGIAAVAQKILRPQEVPLFTYSYTMPIEDVGVVFPYNDESPFIDELIQKTGLEHNKKITRSNFDDYKDRLDLSIRLTDGINYNDGMGLDPIKAAAAEDGVNVLLSGFGGDNLASSNVSLYFLDFLGERNLFRFLSDLLVEDKHKRKKLSYLTFWLLAGINRRWANRVYNQLNWPKHKVLAAKRAKSFLSEKWSAQFPQLAVEQNLAIKNHKLPLSLKDKEIFGLTNKALYHRMAGKIRLDSIEELRQDIRLLTLDYCSMLFLFRSTRKGRKNMGGFCFAIAFRNYYLKVLPGKTKKWALQYLLPMVNTNRGHQSIIAWLDSLKSNPRLEMINIEKLIRQAEMFYEKGNNRKSKSRIFGRKQFKLLLLARYLETHPDAYSNIGGSII